MQRLPVHLLGFRVHNLDWECILFCVGGLPPSLKLPWAMPASRLTPLASYLAPSLSPNLTEKLPIAFPNLNPTSQSDLK